jgi:hypothetical protein
MWQCSFVHSAALNLNTSAKSGELSAQLFRSCIAATSSHILEVNSGAGAGARCMLALAKLLQSAT